MVNAVTTKCSEGQEQNVAVNAVETFSTEVRALFRPLIQHQTQRRNNVVRLDTRQYALHNTETSSQIWK